MRQQGLSWSKCWQNRFFVTTTRTIPSKSVPSRFWLYCLTISYVVWLREMFLDLYYLVFTLMQGLGDYNVLNLTYLAKLFGLQLHLQAHSQLRAFPSTVRIACVAGGISRASAFCVAYTRCIATLWRHLERLPFEWNFRWFFLDKWNCTSFPLRKRNRLNRIIWSEFSDASEPGSGYISCQQETWRLNFLSC